LIESGGFASDIIDEEEQSFGIFKPLRSPLGIQKQFNSLAKITPPLASFSDEKKIFDQTTTTEIILSSLISEYISLINFPLKKGRNNKFDLSLFDALFHNVPFKAEGFETKEFAKSIDRYFAIFDLLNSDLKFKLFIEPYEDAYSLSIKVNDKYLHKHKQSDQKLQILMVLVKFSEEIYELHSLIKKQQVILSKQRLEEFILFKKDFILDLGIDIILPKELKNLLKPKLQIKVKSSSKSFQSFLSLDKLLEYDYEIAIGDATISQSEFEKLSREGQELVKFRDNFVILNAKEVQNIFKSIEKNKTLDRYELLHLNFNDEIELDENLQTYLGELFSFKEFTQPQIDASLRAYQSRGFNWAVNNLLNGFGVIFADDMGLGKTLQTITVLKYLKINGHLNSPALVVVPTTLLNNWAKEIEKFAPSLSFTQYYGAKRKFKEADMVFTTYHTLGRDL
jgi:SNF2 family DNA or RNA helicase